VTALGHEIAGFFPTSGLQDSSSPRETDGRAPVAAPLLDFHKESMKGLYADLKNISGGDMGPLERGRGLPRAVRRRDGVGAPRHRGHGLQELRSRLGQADRLGLRDGSS
jgi:hypothetical protein